MPRCLQEMPQNVYTWTKLISDKRASGHGREALRLYKAMREEGVLPNSYTFVAALKACSAIAELEGIHRHAKSSGETNVFVASTLISIYAKCGCIEKARYVFEKMIHQNVVSWNAMIMGYAHIEMGTSALQLYSRMQIEGFAPNAVTFIGALKACASLAAQEEGKVADSQLLKTSYLNQGRGIHNEIAKRGLESDLFVANTLIDMYAKCGSLEDARHVFENMSQKSVVSWTALIMGYAQMEMGDLALELYARMQNEGFVPDAGAFVAALKACASLAARKAGTVADEEELSKTSYLNQGRAIHAEAAKSGFESDIFVANTLIDMYMKCGSIEDARQVFEKISYRNVVSWNAMIIGYAQMEMGDSALELYARMQSEGFAPDARTFVAALKACASLAVQQEGKGADDKVLKARYLEQGRDIHSEAAKRGLESDIFVASTLVDMYAKCGSIEDARHIFEKMKHRNVVAWTAMIIRYAQREMGALALELYARMQNEGFNPNDRTFVAVLNACASLATQVGGNEANGGASRTSYLEQGRAIHAEVAKRGLESDIFVASSLVDMYAKCGSIEDAHHVFEKVRHRNVVFWTAMITGYAQINMGALALKLFADMQKEGLAPDAHTFVAALKACASLAAQEEGKGANNELLKASYLEQGRAIHAEIAKRQCESDVFVASTLIDMYAKCGSMKDARIVFESMKDRNVVAWNAMISGYVQMEMGDVALELYLRMQHEGFTPDAHTFVAVLQACGSLASLETGKEVHSKILKVGSQGHPFIANCLIDMYSKCGSMWDAQQVFDSLLVRNSVTWNVLITGYGGQGDSDCVFDLYKRMQQDDIEPDIITFVSVLNSCSYDGLVDEGQKYFQAMSLEYGIFPSRNHYSCMTDLLGKAGHLDEAAAIAMKMQIEPDTLTWMTILGACQKWNNVETGRSIFECAVMLDEKFAVAYILMTNIYMSSQMWEESARMEEMRINAGAQKKLGQCRWTDSSGMVHTFLAGDRSHFQSKEIYAKLRALFIKMREEGYVPGLDIKTSDIQHEVKEDVLCGHSEILAIACALINTPPRTTIRIVKNLQVCLDCHKAAVFISKIEQRTIMCRDASRFHVFKDGKCSCGYSGEEFKQNTEQMIDHLLPSLAINNA